ncbi:MAG: hypothetical protein K2G60_04965 [Oscillospiraceae bacterium]|nr:hypothetical protein [Oscillospiraceae bacterium]
MKNIKLKETKLCFLILISPILAAAALLIGSAVVTSNAPEYSVWQNLPFAVIALIIVSAILFVNKLGMTWLILFGSIENINQWKKDRRFYFTDVNGRIAEEAVKAIGFRMNHYAKELTALNKSENMIGAYKKRRHSWNEDTSGFEDFYILYETETLTKDFCSQAVAECKSIMRKYGEKGIHPFLQTKRERKKPVTRSCAMVIVCNKADFDAVSYVRRNFSKGHTGLAVCICEMGTGRYFFNGAAQSSDGIFESSAEAISVNLIKKVVFCKNLGLNENSYYMSTDDLPYNPETTLYEAFEHVKKEMKTSEHENKKIAKKLEDGEVYFDGEGVFYKKNGRTLLFAVIDEEECEGEEPNGKKYMLVSKSWSYPKSSKMSNKDYDEALSKIDEYLKNHGIDFEFKDFDKWFEEQ